MLSGIMGEKEKILLADDSEITRHAVKITIEVYEEESGHEVIAEASSVEEVELLLESGVKPTVALIDGRMPNEGDGKKAAALIRSKSPQTKIVSFSTDLQTWGDENWEKGDLIEKDLIKKIDEL